MERFRIIPIKIGQFLGLEHSNFTYGHSFGDKIPVPIIMYLLKGSKTSILVDTGCAPPDWANKYHPPITQTEDQIPSNALKKHGITPDNLDFVIITHMHWDHAFNNGDYTKCPIIVQKKEWEYALNPLPCHYHTYESQHGGFYPPFLRNIENQKLRIIEGEREIVPGVRVIPLPGHTPGMQGVHVATDDGDRLICSDAVPLYENWEHQPRLPSGIHCNLFDYYATLEKIASFNCPILPGHDAKVFDLYPNGSK